MLISDRLRRNQRKINLTLKSEVYMYAGEMEFVYLVEHSQINVHVSTRSVSNRSTENETSQLISKCLVFCADIL